MKNSLFTFLVFAVTIIVALILVTNAFTSGGNTISYFAKYALIASFFIGLQAKKTALYILVLMTGYLDMLKRVMIIDARVGLVDLYYVLGMAPILLAGITCGLVLRYTFKNEWREGEWKLLLVSCVLFVILALSQLGSGLSASTLGQMANDGAYLFLLFVVASLIRGTEDIRKLMFFIVFVFIPVALYTFWQAKVGLSDFEYNYLLSGLSLEARQLDERIFRPFSTMNAAGNLSTMMGILAVACFYIGFGYLGRVSFLTRAIFWAMVPMFCYAAYLTFSRGGWVCAMASFGAVMMFGSRFRTILFYSVGLIAAILIVAFAGVMVKEDTMAKVTGAMLGKTQTDEEFMVKKVGTFTSRLESIDLTLRESKRWRPFGVVVEGVTESEFGRDQRGYNPYYVHDGFSFLLLKFGYIPVAIICVLGLVLLFKTHQGLLQLDLATRRPALLLWGLVLGIGVGFSANLAQLKTFPINVYFYLFGSLVYVLIRSGRSVRVTAEESTKRPLENRGPGRLTPVGATGFGRSA